MEGSKLAPKSEEWNTALLGRLETMDMCWPVSLMATAKKSACRLKWMLGLSSENMPFSQLCP